MNFKKTAVCLMACALSLSLFGCELVTVNEEKDKSQAIMVLGDKTYSKDVVNGYMNSQLINYGIDKPEEKAYDEYRIQMAEEYAKEKAISYYAVQNGYRDKLTDEDKKAVDDEMAKITTRYETELVEEAKETLGFTGEDAPEIDEAAQQRINKLVETNRIAYLNEQGAESLEDKKEQLLDIKAAEQYVKTLEDAVKVSDEEIKAEYEKLSGEQKKSYDSDPSAYMTAAEGEDAIVYTPAGFRKIKHVLIKIDEESATKIKALETEIAEMTDGDEKTNKQSELDILKTDAFSKIKDKAQGIVDQAKKGSNFDKLVTDNGEDEGMKSNPDGYLMHEKVTDKYEAPFQEAGMALGKVGDISELVQTAYGYHILQYASDVESKTVDYETAKEKISAEILENKKQKAVSEKITSIYDGYKSDGTLKIYFERLKTASVPGK